MKRITKILIIIFLAVLSLDSFAQNTRKTDTKICSCKGNSLLKDIVGCDTIRFKNNAFIYWQYNCDSTWLTFENTSVKKIMYSLEAPLIELKGRVGYIFVKEYQEKLLFINKKASGGGFPVDYEILDKNNGQILEELGTIIYYSDSTFNNYILYISSDSIDTLTYYNINNSTKFKYPIPKGRLWKTVRESNQMFPEFLFDDPIIVNNILTLSYKYLISDSPNQWSQDKIFIDLKQTQ